MSAGMETSGGHFTLMIDIIMAAGSYLRGIDHVHGSHGSLPKLQNSVVILTGGL